MSPRTREFAEDELLIKAMHLFWHKGYAGTSVRDLVENTGVAHAGLYAAFKDKDGLFKASLRKYATEILGKNFANLEHLRAGRAEIETLFSNATKAFQSGILSKGCFVANSAVEFAGAPGPVTDIVTRCFNREVKAFEHALKNAVATGQARRDLKVTRVAHAMATTFFGMSAIARAGASRTAIKDAAAAAVAQMNTA